AGKKPSGGRHRRAIRRWRGEREGAPGGLGRRPWGVPGLLFHKNVLLRSRIGGRPLRPGGRMERRLGNLGATDRGGTAPRGARDGAAGGAGVAGRGAAGGRDGVYAAAGGERGYLAPATQVVAPGERR